MQFIDVMVTCPNRACALTIARDLVSERLAACANIGGDITSVYRWQGAIEEATEVTLLLKTRAGLFDQVASRVRALHPYDTPCIIATEIVAIDPDYAAWLEAETG